MQHAGARLLLVVRTTEGGLVLCNVNIVVVLHLLVVLILRHLLHPIILVLVLVIVLVLVLVLGTLTEFGLREVLLEALDACRCGRGGRGTPLTTSEKERTGRRAWRAAAICSSMSFFEE